MDSSKVMNETMSHEFKINGYWWMPHLNKKVEGILYFSQEKVKLELKGSISEDPNIDEYKIIWGETESGEELTLFNTYRTLYDMRVLDSYKQGSQIDIPESYSINSFLVGGLHQNLDSVKFSSCTFLPSYFHQWIQKTDSTFMDTYVEDATLRIKGLNNCYQRGFILQPKDSHSINWYLKYIDKLRKLLMLMSGHPIFNERLEFLNETDQRTYTYFITSRSTKKLPDLQMKQCLIRYVDIEKDVCRIFSKWFTLYEDLKIVTGIYFSDWYMDKFLEMKFLNAVQIIEIFHSWMRKDEKKVISSDSHAALERAKLALNEAIPDYNKIIKVQLKEGKKFVLQNRFENLLKELDEKTKEFLLGNDEEVTVFTNQAVQTRNHFTHYGKEQRFSLSSNAELTYTMYRLRALITVLLLKEIGVSELIIRQKMMNRIDIPYTQLHTAKKFLNTEKYLNLLD
ncbi:HEPN domain-containing protein [Priestia megaterium]|uniref:ApeA N-terminal domain 1-containing protein n=1 Tax=Priestia megaterium TaxID=1404 RepID=UPI000BFB4D1B|nr:HEPN domain-containing protein [Priestia megaterium]PGT75533.1 hypothetical protein COD15_07260 [Priestia megaterium]